MKLFEDSFTASWRYFVREYDTDAQKSEIRELPDKWEYYDYHDGGNFKSLYNPKNKFVKQSGKLKDTKNKIATVSPIDVVIRSQYPQSQHYNHKPRIMYLDIETRVGTVVPGFPVPEKSLEPVCLIQFLDSERDMIHIIADKEFYYSRHYLSLPDHKGKEVKFWKCSSEVEMFELFFKFIKALKPAIVYAWNGEGFDFPYLFNRAKRLGLNVNKFSPWQDKFGGDIVKLKENQIQDKYVANIQAPGIHYIDLLRLYRKIVLEPRESYSLMAIAIKELKAKKIEHEEFKTFDDFYQGNYQMPANPTPEQMETLCYKLAKEGADYSEIQKAGYGQFVYYGIIDTVLIKDIDEKVGLTKLLTMIAGMMSSRYSDVLGTVGVWGNAIRNRLYQQGTIINNADIQVDLEKSIEGGYVREPQKGRHRAVLSADVNSMYPILAISGLNMSPETFRFYYQVPKDLSDFVVKELKVGTPDEQSENNMLRLIEDKDKLEQLKSMLKKYNLCMAPNGTFYDKSVRGIVPQMVDEIYSGRKAAKKEMINADKALQIVRGILSDLDD